MFIGLDKSLDGQIEDDPLGNFLVIISSKDFQSEANQLFRSSLEIARYIKFPPPDGMVETEWAYAASFARQNGSGTPIVYDPETESWLLAIGVWFHGDGYGSGEESRLLARYLELDPLLVGRELEGFFVIVIGDGRTQETIVLTDIVGSCHCFFRSWKQGIALSSSSLLLAGLGNFNLDPVGCQEFLCTGIIYEDRTFYQEVHKLEPASVFRFAKGTLVSRQRYWQITDIVPESLDGQFAVRRLGETLMGTAQKVGRIFTRPVCDLTGGYDSRALVSAFLSSGVKFTTVVSGPADSPDVMVSRSLAQVIGLPHLHIEPPGSISLDYIRQALGLTDGEYDLVEYARILRIHRILSEQFDISINGSFGELARGYWWELLFPHTGAYRKLDSQKLAKLRYAAQSFDASLFPPETKLDLVSHFADVIERTNRGLSQFPNTLQMDHVYLMMRMQRWQGRIASSTNRLWPCLSPFLFRPVLETVLQTRAYLRQRSLLIRRMLAELQPRMAEFPLEHGYPALPVTWKNFYRFWPLLGYYGTKVLSKMAHQIGRNWLSQTSPIDYDLIRLQLWSEEEVQELLRPTAMELGCLVDPAALNNFIQRSRQKNFPFNKQWVWILSLEYTLRVLKAKKVQLQPVS